MFNINYLPLITFPSILIGAIIMQVNDIPKSIWLQNIVVTILLTLLSFIMFKRKINKQNTKTNYYVSVFIILLLLTLPFFNEGIEGVYRWIALGPVSLNIASIILPLLLIMLGKIGFQNQWWFSYVIVLVTSSILVLQPDASAVTAFVIAACILLLCRVNKSTIRLVLSLIPLSFLIVSWIFLDDLAPVSYVEDILMMAKDLGIIWFVISLLALMSLMIPFLLFPPEKGKITSISLGIYFSILLLTTFLGNFPVIIMGYGVSPILGYYIAINWFIRCKQENKSF